MTSPWLTAMRKRKCFCFRRTKVLAAVGQGPAQASLDVPLGSGEHVAAALALCRSCALIWRALTQQMLCRRDHLRHQCKSDLLVKCYLCCCTREQGRDRGEQEEVLEDVWGGAMFLTLCGTTLGRAGGSASSSCSCKSWLVQQGGH